jgi:hypothetical protein
MPWAAWISRLCDEFGGYPGQALQAWQESPAGLLEEIIEGRAYARAKHEYDHLDSYDDKGKAQVLKKKMVQTVVEIAFDLAREARAERENG